MAGKHTRFNVEDIEDNTSVQSTSPASPRLSQVTSTTNSALSVYVTPPSSPGGSKSPTRRSSDRESVDEGDGLSPQRRVAFPREFQVSSPLAAHGDGSIPPLVAQHSLNYTDTVEPVPMTLFYRQDSGDTKSVTRRRPTLKELHDPIRVDEVRLLSLIFWSLRPVGALKSSVHPKQCL